MKQLAVINSENAVEAEVQTYRIREAARAIVLDEDKNVALLYVTKKGYYKLPGGGIDAGEAMLTALRRECLEEIGCDIDILGEVGSVVEHRKIFHLEQTSYCYLAKVKGAKGTPAFTDEEKENGFEIVWLPYDTAVEAVAKPTDGDAEALLYISERDSILLTAARPLVKSE